MNEFVFIGEMLMDYVRVVIVLLLLIFRIVFVLVYFEYFKL